MKGKTRFYLKIIIKRLSVVITLINNFSRKTEYVCNQQFVLVFGMIRIWKRDGGCWKARGVLLPISPSKHRTFLRKPSNLCRVFVTSLSKHVDVIKCSLNAAVIWTLDATYDKTIKIRIVIASLIVLNHFCRATCVALQADYVTVVKGKR